MFFYQHKEAEATKKKKKQEGKKLKKTQKTQKTKFKNFKKKARAFVVNAVLFYSYEHLLGLLGGRDPSDAASAAISASSDAALKAEAGTAAATVRVAAASSSP